MFSTQSHLVFFVWTSKTNHLCFSPFCPLSHSGRLLDATKNYKYIFLLAGSEVVLSALVLGISNFLCMRKKSATSLEDLAAVEQAKLEMRSEEMEMTREEGDEEEERGAQDVEEEEIKGEEVEGFAAVDSQEEEKFLKNPQPNGEASSNPETCL